MYEKLLYHRMAKIFLISKPNMFQHLESLESLQNGHHQCKEKNVNFIWHVRFIERIFSESRSFRTGGIFYCPFYTMSALKEMPLYFFTIQILEFQVSQRARYFFYWPLLESYSLIFSFSARWLASHCGIYKCLFFLANIFFIPQNAEIAI